MPKLTPKQKKFADTYLDTGNGTQSAKEAYDVKDDNSAAVVGSVNLRKVKVQQYLEDRAEKAAVRVVELSEQEENLNVALGASKDILDRAGFKPIDKSQTLNVNMEVILDEKMLGLKRKYEEELRKTIME